MDAVGLKEFGIFFIIGEIIELVISRCIARREDGILRAEYNNLQNQEIHKDFVSFAIGYDWFVIICGVKNFSSHFPRFSLWVRERERGFPFTGVILMAYPPPGAARTTRRSREVTFILLMR